MSRNNVAQIGVNTIYGFRHWLVSWACPLKVRRDNYTRYNLCSHIHGSSHARDFRMVNNQVWTFLCIPPFSVTSPIQWGLCQWDCSGLLSPSGHEITPSLQEMHMRSGSLMFSPGTGRALWGLTPFKDELSGPWWLRDIFFSGSATHELPTFLWVIIHRLCASK